jgi:rod shape determining protein RodA
LIKVNKKIFIHFDYVLPILLLPLIFTSYFLVKELHPVLAHKQLVYFSIGFLTFLFFFLFPIKRLLWIVPVFYWFDVILLLSVKLFGVTKLGAKRWLEIPFTHFTIQPSEIMKPALVMILLYLVKKYRPENEKYYNLKEFLRLSIYILIPFLLIIEEPDLGTALMILIVGFGTLFVIGVDWKIWTAIVVIVSLSAPFLYNSLHDYQKKRIQDFLNKPSYHVQQAVIAIGSGGTHGRSKEEATQSHLKFLPISTSDFIFSFFMERFGFVGGVLLITLYFLIILHLLMMVRYSQGEYLMQIVSAALAFLFFVHMGVNIAMNIGYAPVVGIPLPLMSYGGTSFMTTMIIIGIYENLVTFRHDDLYESINYEGEEE